MEGFILMELLRSDASVSVNKALIHSIGLNQAILFCEILSRGCYFYGRGELDNEGYFYNTQYQLLAATGIGEKGQRTALKKLEELKLLKSAIKGTPPKRHYKIVARDSQLLELIKQGRDILKAIQDKDNLESYGWLKKKKKPSNIVESSITSQGCNQLLPKGVINSFLGSTNNTKYNTKYNTKTDCPELEIEQKFEQEKTKIETNNKIESKIKSVSTKRGTILQTETNNKIDINYLKNIYEYNEIIKGHYDDKIVDEVLNEIMKSVNSKGKNLKICGSKKEGNEIFESVDVFTGRVLKFNKNNIIDIVDQISNEMKETKIKHVDLLVRTKCINQNASYIKDKTKSKKNKELNSNKNYNQVPQETNYEQREYTEEYLESFYENYWDKHK